MTRKGLGLLNREPWQRTRRRRMLRQDRNRIASLSRLILLRILFFAVTAVAIDKRLGIQGPSQDLLTAGTRQAPFRSPLTFVSDVEDMVTGGEDVQAANKQTIMAAPMHLPSSGEGKLFWQQCGYLNKADRAFILFRE